MGTSDYVREIVQSALILYLIWQIYKSKRK